MWGHPRPGRRLGSVPVPSALLTPALARVLPALTGSLRAGHVGGGSRLGGGKREEVTWTPPSCREPSEMGRSHGVKAAMGLLTPGVAGEASGHSETNPLACPAPLTCPETAPQLSPPGCTLAPRG